MGDLVRLNEAADQPADPGADVLTSVAGWVALVREGKIRKPITALLILEDAQGQVWQATDTTLARCDRARLLGILDIAAAHRRAGTGNLVDAE